MKISLLLFLVISACSYTNFSDNHIPDNFQIIENIKCDFTAEKCIYSPYRQIILAKEDNKIHIFQNGEKQNTIGGFGFGQNNFSNLSDICLGFDDSFFTLDNVQKIIKKFDLNGKFIAEFSLENFSNPTKFDFSENGNFCIFDDDTKEVSIFNFMAIENSFSFGKFQLSNITQLTISQQFITVFDGNLNNTICFNKMGQFISKTDGQIEYFGYHQLRLKKYFIENLTLEKKFLVSSKIWHFFQIKNNFCVLANQHEIVIAKIISRLEK